MKRIFENNKFLLLIAAINIIAGIFSLQYYAAQISATSPVLWLFVPDSIIATLIFGVALVLLSRKMISNSIAALAISGMWKYGLWSLFVLYSGGNAFVPYWYFYIGHVLMIVETIILFKRFKLKAYDFAPAILFFFANDILDYFFDLHPPFSQIYFSETMWLALLLTVFVPILVVLVYSKDK